MEISVYSEDGKYRYLSEERISDSSDRELLIVMFNPATTSEAARDPKRERYRQTRHRCLNLARELGIGILTVANLFAYRAGRKQDLKKVAVDPVGPENDHWICGAVRRADMVMVAWGKGGAYLGRSEAVLSEVLEVQIPYYIGKESSGDPKHPRRWPKDPTPILWR